MLWLALGSLLLTGCGRFHPIAEAKSPDGTLEARLLGFEGQVNSRMVTLVRLDGGGERSTVFEAERTSAAVAWQGNGDVLIYYSDESADFLKFQSTWAIKAGRGPRRIVRIHLRPQLLTDTARVVLR
jgi:hypothetical protein